VAFDEVQFDPTIARGSRSGPGFNVDVTATESKQAVRIRRGDQAFHAFDVRISDNREHIDYVRSFFLQRRGSERGFRMKDWDDFKSTGGDQILAAVSATDQVIGLGTGSSATYQLTKTYGASGPAPFVRNIRKPVAGTVVVAFDGVAQSSGWSVDTTTGVVTTTADEDVVITAGFEFDVPVYLVKPVGDGVMTAQDSWEGRSVESLEFREIADVEAVSQPLFSGGSVDVEISADYSWGFGLCRLLRVDATTTGLSVILPNPASQVGGGPYLAVTAVTGSSTFAVKEPGGSTLANLAAGSTLELWIAQGASSKLWEGR